jgi:hypothetical protein
MKEMLQNQAQVIRESELDRWKRQKQVGFMRMNACVPVRV